MQRPKAPIRHCAIYTRKSSEEGLEQDFNSLQAQREACEAFIKSQAGMAGAVPPPMTMAVSLGGPWNDRRSASAADISQGCRCGGCVQGRPTYALAGGLRQDG